MTERDHLIEKVKSAIPASGVAFCPPLARALMVKVAALLQQAEFVPAQQGADGDDPHRDQRNIIESGGALMESRDLAAEK
jgi:hypothetical protein